MTQLSIIDSKPKRRGHDAWLVGAVSALGFLPSLGVVLLRRMRLAGAQRTRVRTSSESAGSLLAEVRSELDAAVALVFSA